MATSAENHTANRVAELCLRAMLNNKLAQIAMSVPSTRQSTILSVDTWAIASRLKGAVIAGSLAPFQQQAEGIEFFRIDTGLLENVQQELFMRVAEETADQVPNFEACGILAIDVRGVYVRALVLHVLQVALLFQDADDGQVGVVGQGGLGGEGGQHLVDARRAAFPTGVSYAQLALLQGDGL